MEYREGLCLSVELYQALIISVGGKRADRSPVGNQLPSTLATPYLSQVRCQPLKNGENGRGSGG